MQALYFAYGSNLCSARMLERVPSARAAGVARLAGYRLTTDKAGRDGTGKANLQPAVAEAVWGLVWQLDAADWPALDACERGYDRIPVAPDPVPGTALDAALGPAQTYLSRQFTANPVLASQYKRFLVDGAREHGLPTAWIDALEALPSR